jgi:hypothetical protein
VSSVLFNFVAVDILGLQRRSAGRALSRRNDRASFSFRQGARRRGLETRRAAPAGRREDQTCVVNIFPVEAAFEIEIAPRPLI